MATMTTMDLILFIEDQTHKRGHILDLVFNLGQRHCDLGLGDVNICPLSWITFPSSGILFLVSIPCCWKVGLFDQLARQLMELSGFQKEPGFFPRSTGAWFSRGCGYGLE